MGADLSEIIWFCHVVEKLEEKHHVSQREVEEVFQGNPRVRRIEQGAKTLWQKTEWNGSR
jgi:hypothetical protein